MLLSFCYARAQQPDLSQFGQGTGNLDTLSELTVDTSDLYRYFSLNPDQEFDFADTLLGDYFTQYDPIRKASPDLGHLGNLGSPHQQLVFHPQFRRGVHLGFDQYEAYRIYAKDLTFYRTEQAYTLARFSQGPTQDDLQFGVEFSREFANQVTFSINYQRINNLGSYNRQKATSDAFAVGFRFRSPNQRYDAFTTYANNVNTQEENGGISLEPAILSDPLTIAVKLETAETRYASRQFRLDQHYKLRMEKDSMQKNRTAIVAAHSFEFRRDSYKFFDDSPSADSSFYGVLQTDSRGLRQFIGMDQYHNAFRFRTFRLWPKDSTGVKNQRDLLEVGLEHTAFFVNQEPLDTVLQNLFLTGKWKVSPFNGLNIEANGHYGLAANAGDYRVDGTLLLNLKKLGQFKATVINQLNRPDRLAAQAFVSQQAIWENDFKKTLETSLIATYQIPEWNLAVSGRYHLINNLVYYDQQGVAQQTSIPISIPQLLVKAKLKVWKLHLDNEVVLQRPTETEIRIPEIYSNHQFYFYGNLFKKVMLAKIGFDLRLTSGYKPNAYQPLIGRFYLQEDLQTDWQPIVDGFVSFKVDKFRFFFRFENALPFLTDKYYYLAADYPIDHTQIRFGLNWQFVD